MTISASRACFRRLAILVALLSAGGAAADTTTLRAPGTCASTPGTTPPLVWTNASNATGTMDGQARAETGALNPSQVSDHLRCTNFGFSIPDGSTIDGITMQVRRRRAQSGQITGDGHVQALLPNGSLGTADLAQPCTAANDWTTTYGTPSYGGSSNTWGTTWGACAAANVTCPAPPGAFNVNHQNFGLALAAQTCPTSTGNGAAWVDWMQAQIAFTPPACAGAAWGPIVVQSPGPLITDSDVARQTVNYVIQTTTPNMPGCAMVAGTQILLTFSCMTTDTTTLSSAALNGVAIPLGSITRPGGPHTLQFTPPPGALGPCSGQNCLPPGGAFQLVLQGVRNPQDAGPCSFTLAATNVANGNTGTATSPSYTITDPCRSSGTLSSPWTPLTVALADPGVSLPGCPRHTRFTITTKTPRPSGCVLTANTSTLELVMPASADLTKLTAATVKVGTAAPVAATPAKSGQTVTLTPTTNVPNDTDLVITLDVVGAPTSPAAGQTLTLQGKNTANGETAVTTSSPGYAITAAPCAPELDFYVRDWTSTSNATSHDVGNEPSGGPAATWALTSDVWNQYVNTSVDPATATGWIPGKQPTTMGSNHAYARISRKTTGAAPAFDRTVTATFFAAPFGMGPQFGQIGTTTKNLAYDSPMDFVHVSWTPGTLPVGADRHICLAVEIDSPSDPVIKNAATQESINADIPDTASKVRIEGNNNQAQRNLTQVDTATDFPIPPPPPPPAGGGGGGMGGMRHFALIHNAALETRDMTLQMDASGDTMAQLQHPQVGVVGEETIAYEPGGRFTLPAMRPGEDRWIAFSYGLAAGGEGELPPIGFVQTDGKERTNGFGFVIRRAPVLAVATDNLRHHADTFARLATPLGIGEAKSESAAAAALVRKGDVSDAGYLAFLAEHRDRIAAIVRALRKDEPDTDPLGLESASQALDAAVTDQNARAGAVSHLALLERLDAAASMRLLARGNPLDIVQMVRWERALYTNHSALRDLPVAANVVKRADAFLATAVPSKPDGRRYARLIGDDMKDMRTTAAALKKQGIDVGPALRGLERTSRSDTAALQKAHRGWLLALDGAAGGGGGAQQQQRQ